MDKQKRAMYVVTMNDMIRGLNDESIVEIWLMSGVADGDENMSLEEFAESSYVEDKCFADLMALFARLINYAVEEAEGDYEKAVDRADKLMVLDGVWSERDKTWD